MKEAYTRKDMFLMSKNAKVKNDSINADLIDFITHSEGDRKQELLTGTKISKKKQKHTSDVG